MKSILILVFVCISVCCRGNAVDDLKTLEDVKAFLKSKSKSSPNVDYFGTEKQDTTARLAKIKFIKIDLNNDGFTDLLINGAYLFAMIDDGKDDFASSFIDRGTFTLKKYVLVDIDTSEKQPKVLVKAYSNEFNSTPNAHGGSKQYTLVYKFGGFVEYTKQAEDEDIEEITMSTSGCYGTCPVFELSIVADGAAIYNAIRFNASKGSFSTEIDKASLDELFGLTSYIHASRLKRSYEVNWSDDQTADLTITYKDGPVKKISDYGLIGTFGLQRLYELIFSLRKSQKWEAI